MAKRLSAKHSPNGLALGWWIAVGLLLDRISAPGWVWGAVGLLAVLYWVMVVISWFTDDHLEPRWKTDLPHDPQQPGG